MFYIANTIQTPTRYDIVKFMSYSNGCLEVMDSALINLITQLPSAGAFEVTTQEGRPDLLSYDIYGNTQYWYILLLYNGILKITDLKTGVVVNFPSLDRLENFYMRLVNMQKTGD